MVDHTLPVLFYLTATLVSADVCYYDDGSHNGHVTLCPGSCCGTGSDPCCPISNEILPFVVGSSVAFCMLFVCFTVCCVYRVRTDRSSEIPKAQETRQEMLSELRQASTEYHIVVFNGKKDCKLEFPPRYSEIYPSTKSTIDKDSYNSRASTKSKASNSLKRSSTIRNAFRRGPVSSSTSIFTLTRNNSKRSSLMQSIAASLPSIFQKEDEADAEDMEKF